MSFFHRVDNLVISRNTGDSLVTSSTSAVAFDCQLPSHQIVTNRAVIKAWEAKEQYLVALLEILDQELALQIGCYKLHHESIMTNMSKLCIILTDVRITPTINNEYFYHIIASNLVWELLDSYIDTVRSKGEPR
jgi:hypothetical protein